FVFVVQGIGNVVIQIAALVLCKKCIGIERASWPCRYASIFEREFRLWMKWFGKPHSEFKLFKGDFLDEEFRSILKSGNAIFVNNLSFNNDHHHRLKMCFYDLQAGSRIISSKPFCEPNFRVTARNVNVTVLDNLENTVSWTSTPIPFYLQTIDYSRIEQYFAGIAKKRGHENNSEQSVCPSSSCDEIKTISKLSSAIIELKIPTLKLKRKYRKR
ncbi:unnamed protein product, partial [Didymodactylos carnosus]